MATWKKIVVSGSNVSQLNNDAGYLTAGTLGQSNGFATASFDGVNLLADSTVGSLNFASSSNQGLTISANAGTDTLTFGLSAIPNNSLANSSITIGSTNIALGATATTLAGLTSITSTSFTGSFTGSFAGDGSQLTGIVATATSLQNAIASGEGIAPFSYTNIAPVTVAVSGAVDLTDNAITKWDNNDGKFQNSSLTDNGTVVSGASSIQLSGANSSLTGSFTGSFVGDGSGLTGVASTLTVTGDTGGTTTIALQSQQLDIEGTTNEIETTVSSQKVTIGLPNNVTIGNNLTVSNNLTVIGTASFQHTSNLEVADRFVLLASGSNTNGDGGIVVQQDTQNVGELFGWDSGTSRWAVTGSFVANQGAFTPDAFMAAAINLTATDPNTTSPDIKYNKKGNIYVATGAEDIWIYS
jgi:hypothetical protein